MEKLDSTSYHNFVAEGNKVVEFIAEWCIDCKRLSFSVPAWEETYTNFQFGSVDVDLDRKLAKDQDIKGVPTFLVYKDGREVGRLPSREAKNEENVQVFLHKHSD